MRRFLIIAACCCAILCACSTQKIDNKEPSEANQIQDDSQTAPEPAHEDTKLQEGGTNSEVKPFVGGITMFVGDEIALVNSVEKRMPAAPFVDHGIFFFPLCFVTEIYGWQYSCTGDIVTVRTPEHVFQYVLNAQTFFVDDIEYTQAGIAMLFDSSASDEERKAAAPYFYPKEKDGVVFFPSGYGSSEQHSPSLFIISQYVQWNMIIFEGFAEELGFAGIYLQHNWDDLSKEETEGMISCGIIGDALTMGYEVEEYEGRGLHALVLREKADAKETECGLDGNIISVYATSSETPTPRGVRCGDTELDLLHAYGFAYAFPYLTFGYDANNDIVTKVGFHTYEGLNIPEACFENENW